MELLGEGYKLDSDNWSVLQVLFHGVLTPILGLIATIGIIFTITMQSPPKLKDRFLKVLCSLACYGSIIITCRVINHTCRIFDAGASIYTDIAQTPILLTQTILYMNGVGVQDFYTQ